MRCFNVLDPSSSIFGNKLLEASAGTGKTFAIEHLVARLLLEAPQGEDPLSLDQILVITFTRAATRELRMRVHATLKRAGLSSLGAQIFTIHGFCHKMLIRFGFEAGVPLLEQDPEQRGTILSQLLNFLMKQDVLVPEQLGLLLGRRSVRELCEDLLDAPCPDGGESFSESSKKIVDLFRGCPLRAYTLREEFECLWQQFKISSFSLERLREQISSLEALMQDPSDHQALRQLIQHKGSLFRFLNPGNQKARVKERANAPCFDWVLEAVAPVLLRASDPKRVFQTLRYAAQELMDKESFFSHELLLHRCARAIEKPEFCQAVRGCYRAVIVDEFQDTDSLQWRMIKELFYSSSRLFCLVGDPKQSIYRFRKADLYSYFAARDFLGSSSCYSLDTNYRSCPELLSALNDLFGEEHLKSWLVLPREKRALPYVPLKAGKSSSSPLGDVAVQFFTGDPLLYATEEIVRIRAHGCRTAILVKDHKEANEARLFLQERGFVVAVKNTIPLSETLAASAWEELFDALHDSTRKKNLLLGPFSHAPLEEWRTLWEQEGFVSFLRKASIQDPSFLHVAELLLEIRVPTYENIKRFFRALEEENTPCRAEREQEGAISILTMHASKGLEFDVVFAFGVTRKSPKEEDLEEQDAEKLRQLYVTFTRAKWRLYVPIGNVAEGSPLALFFAHCRWDSSSRYELSVQRFCDHNPHIRLDCSHPKGAFCVQSLPQAIENPIVHTVLPLCTSRIHSFTSLAASLGESEEKVYSGEPPTPKNPLFSLHTLPRGAEVGVSVHRMFERIFSGHGSPQQIVHEAAVIGSLLPWEDVLQEMVRAVLGFPFLMRAEKIRTEVEFLFSNPPDYCKGFVDLLFLCDQKLYFLDWKTNWLGDGDAFYEEPLLRHAMEVHRYRLQVALYTEALKRSYPQNPFGGAFYCFLRGVHAPNRGILFYD